MAANGDLRQQFHPRLYARQWVWGALTETWKSGHRAALWASLLAAVISAVVGAALSPLVWIGPRGHRHLVHSVTAGQVIVPAAIGLGVVMTTFLAGHLIAMPFRMAKAKEIEHVAQLVDATAQIESANKDHAKTRTALDEAQGRLATSPPAHIARLRLVTTNLVEQFRQHLRPLHYTDGLVTDGTLREIWRGHARKAATALDAYDCAKAPADKTRVALNDHIFTEAKKKFDKEVGWTNDDMARAARRYCDLSLGGSIPILRAEIEQSHPRHPDLVQVRAFLWVGKEQFAIWATMADTGTTPPSESEVLAFIEEIRQSAQYAAANLDAIAKGKAEQDAWDALEEILGRDDYFPGECSNLCHGPEAE